jgi:hypothetical protein
MAALALDANTLVSLGSPLWRGVADLAAVTLQAARPGYNRILVGGLPAVTNGTEVVVVTHPEGAEVQAVQKSGGLARGPERRFEARGGRLVGRPDYYDGQTLIEYKSSFPDPAWPGAAAVIDGFRRQVQLYAVIIADALGKWPVGGRVVAASGQTLDLKIDPAACSGEADAALARLDRLNEALNSGATPGDVAAPAVSACSGCPFQIICPVFWPELGHGRLNALTDAALEGILERLEPGPDGDLYTVYITARSASQHLSRKQAVVLRKSVHGELALAGYRDLLPAGRRKGQA